MRERHSLPDGKFQTITFNTQFLDSESDDVSIRAYSIDFEYNFGNDDIKEVKLMASTSDLFKYMELHQNGKKNGRFCDYIKFLKSNRIEEDSLKDDSLNFNDPDSFFRSGERKKTLASLQNDSFFLDHYQVQAIYRVKKVKMLKFLSEVECQRLKHFHYHLEKEIEIQGSYIIIDKVKDYKEPFFFRFYCNEDYQEMQELTIEIKLDIHSFDDTHDKKNRRMLVNGVDREAPNQFNLPIFASTYQNSLYDFIFLKRFQIANNDAFYVEKYTLYLSSLFAGGLDVDIHLLIDSKRNVKTLDQITILPKGFVTFYFPKMFNNLDLIDHENLFVVRSRYPHLILEPDYTVNKTGGVALKVINTTTEDFDTAEKSFIKKSTRWFSINLPWYYMTLIQEKIKQVAIDMIRQSSLDYKDNLVWVTNYELLNLLDEKHPCTFLTDKVLAKNLGIKKKKIENISNEIYFFFNKKVEETLSLTLGIPIVIEKRMDLNKNLNYALYS